MEELTGVCVLVRGWSGERQGTGRDGAGAPWARWASHGFPLATLASDGEKPMDTQENRGCVALRMCFGMYYGFGRNR